MKASDVTSFSDGEVVGWAEQGTSIHLRAQTATGDPVELSEEEARALAHELLRFANLVE